MDIASLIAELRPLLADPASHLARIEALVKRGEGDAEHEVVRAFASPYLTPHLGELLESPSPAERVKAVRLASSLLGRAEALSILRRTANDASSAVRRASAQGAQRLALPDVSLPFQGQDHGQPPKLTARSTGWVFWGWYFGSLWTGFRSRDRGLVVRRRSADAGVVFPATADLLAQELGAPSAEALRPLLRPGTGPGAPYASFTIPKRSGGDRVICAPRAALRRVQRTILDRWLTAIPPHPACHGFVRGRSILTNARPHAGARLVLKTDVEAFFPTIHFERVAGLFRLHGASAPVARLLASLTTYRELLPDGKSTWPSVLPQGAPTSPAIANLVCCRLDARLSGLAARASATYTRYADDLTFSFRGEGPRDIGRFFWWINAILQQEGFCENAAKRRVLRPSERQTVTGLVVNERPRLSREARRAFRATLFNAEKHGLEAEARGRPRFAEFLLGYAAYARMIEPELGERWLERARALVARSRPDEP